MKVNFIGYLSQVIQRPVSWAAATKAAIPDVYTNSSQGDTGDLLWRWEARGRGQGRCPQVSLVSGVIYVNPSDVCICIRNLILPV